MKRMYVVLGLFLLLGVWAVSCLGQMSYDIQPVPPSQSGAPADVIRRRIELREQLHRRMMDKLINGNGPDQGLFEDMEQQMNQALSEAFSSPKNSNFSLEWTESKTGRTLFITPQNKEQQLEIDTRPDIITIKGKSEQRTNSGTAISSFSNSFSVPADCDGTKVKMSQKDGKIVMVFPYKAMKSVTVPKKEDERKPLPPSDSDIPI